MTQCVMDSTGLGNGIAGGAFFLGLFLFLAAAVRGPRR